VCGVGAAPPTTAVLTAPRPTNVATLSAAGGSAGDTRTPDTPGGPAEVPADAPELPGYELLTYLGDGGMGRVYKARQVRLDRVVAVKIVRPDRFARPGAAERFEREARAVGRLDHPNIVRVFDANDAAGVHFLVMEFLPGTDLSRMVDDRGPLPVTEACEYARQACLGLQHAHEKGLVHRDIKPANLMVCDGVVKILDLGLARLRAPDAGSDDGTTPPAPAGAVTDTLTRDGAVMGTPDYMAPEQAANTAAADIRAEVELPSLVELRPDVPPRLAAVVTRLTAKDPADRYQTPAEAAAALEPFCRARGPGRWLWLAAAVVFGAAAALSAAYAWGGGGW
jgi:serine/threonine protein kinase